MIAAPFKHGQRRNIGGSQFFIDLVDNDFLDSKHPQSGGGHGCGGRHGQGED